MSSVIQTVLSSGALILGFTYVVGGLIVNLNLARRGITEYQILKVKYLVVGIVFLLNSVGSFVLAAIPAFFSLILAENILVSQVLSIVSIIAGSSLILAWAKLPQNTDSPMAQRWFWFFASVVGALFPMTVLIRQILASRFDIYSVVLVIEGLMSAVLVFIGQIYHYSAFYYGRSGRLFGSLDPIGLGIPTPVRLACGREEFTLLENLGLPVIQPCIIGEVFLIDETEKQYIIGLQREGGETIKIPKETIKAILYKFEHKQATVKSKE
jgi:hypothetical protein